MSGETLRVRVPPPLVPPAPGAGGADRAAWFSHLIWAPLVAVGSVPGLFSVVSYQQESHTLRLRFCGDSTIPASLLDAVAEAIPRHGIAVEADRQTLLLQLPPRWPWEWTAGACVRWNDEHSAYRIETFDPSCGMRLRRQGTHKSDDALPEVIDAFVIAETDEAMECLEFDVLDAAMELSHPRLHSHPFLSCWAAGSRSGFATQRLTWHRGPIDRSRAMITRLSRIPTLTEHCARLYGPDAMMAATVVSPATELQLLSQDVAPRATDRVRVLINRENPTRSALVKLLDRLATPTGIRFEAIPVAWKEIFDQAALSSTDASIITEWTPAVEHGHERGFLPGLNLTLHPEISVAARRISAVKPLVRHPMPVKEWRLSLARKTQASASTILS